MTSADDLRGAGGAPGRDETDEERIDRNWSELLQEMRVTQAGVQILFGFLLTLPFQGRFDELDNGQRVTYLGVLALVSASAVLLLTPVIVHRSLFRQDRKHRLLAASHLLVRFGLWCLGGALTLGVGFVVSVVAGTMWGVASCIAVGVSTVALWSGLPFLLSRSR